MECQDLSTIVLSADNVTQGHFEDALRCQRARFWERPVKGQEMMAVPGSQPFYQDLKAPAGLDAFLANWVLDACRTEMQRLAEVVDRIPEGSGIRHLAEEAAKEAASLRNYIQLASEMLKKAEA